MKGVRRSLFTRPGCRFVLGLVFCVLPFMSTAQLMFQNRPALWPSLSVSKDLGERWKVSAEHSTRLRFMPFSLDELYLQVAGEYNLSYNLSLEMNYRFSEVYDAESRLTPAHRLSWEVEYSGHVKRWTIKVRPAVQTVMSRENQMKDRDAVWAFRPRLKVEYNIRKSSLEPFGALELYLGRRSGETFSLYKYRLTAGLSGDVTKQLKWTAFLRQQGGFFNTLLPSYSILGLELNYSF